MLAWDVWREELLPKWIGTAAWQQGPRYGGDVTTWDRAPVFDPLPENDHWTYLLPAEYGLPEMCLRYGQTVQVESEYGLFAATQGCCKPARQSCGCR